MYKLYILSCVISEIGYISYKLQLSRLIAGLPWLSIICIPTSDLPCDGNATGMFAFFGTVGYFFLKWHSYFTEPVRLPFCTSVCNAWTKDNGRKFFMKEHYSLSSHSEQGRGMQRNPVIYPVAQRCVLPVSFSMDLLIWQ